MRKFFTGICLIMAMCLTSCNAQEARTHGDASDETERSMPEIVFLNVNRSQDGSSYQITFWDRGGRYYSCEDSSVYPASYEELFEAFSSGSGSFVCHEQTCDPEELQKYYALLLEVAEDDSYELEYPMLLPDVVSETVTLHGLYYDADGVLCDIPLHRETQMTDICSADERANDIYSWYMESIKLSGNPPGEIPASPGNEEPDDRIILTGDDIWIFSYNCGYISIDQKPGWQPLLIETPEQLAFAKFRYGLDYPPDYNEEDYWFYDTSLVDFFRDMESRYPMGEYAYLIQYDETNCGGYYLHADKVIIDGDRICFGMDDESYTPADLAADSFADVMGGYLHMAAIPGEYTEGKVFSNVVYPDETDPAQQLESLDAFREPDEPDRTIDDRVAAILGVSAEANEIPEGYLAVFHGGSGELTHETYIYKIDNHKPNMGFYYIHTESCGMTARDWQQKIVGVGELTWTDDCFEAALRNQADSFVTLPGSDKTLTLEEFATGFLMN